jgi:HEAT repeat protein
MSARKSALSGVRRPVFFTLTPALTSCLVALIIASGGQSALAGEYRQADVDREVQALHDPDPGARKHAANVLSEMGAAARSAVPDLILMLKDPAEAGEAANALGKIGPPAGAAVPALIAYLRDPSGGYDRAYAASALGWIGQNAEACVPVLIATVQDDPEPVVRRLAVMSLGCFRADARSAVALLIKQVKEGDKEMRTAAADSIGRIGGQASDIPALADLLKDEIDCARLGAAKALGLLGSEAVGAVPNLVSLLSDQSEDIRLAAAQALGDIGPDASSAVPALKAALGDGNGTFMKHTAEEALEKIEKSAHN